MSVDAGGHLVYMLIKGRGAPTVVLESGLGQGIESWEKVQPEVARFARVVAYDRAGLGRSEPGPKPRTARQIATELHEALKNARLRPPYVLVAHSGSGFTIRVFAGLYPDEVAGMVFVDPTEEGLDDWLKSHRPQVWRQMQEEAAKSSEPVSDELMASEESAEQAQRAGPPPRVPVILLTGMRTNSFRTPELLEFWLGLHKKWLAQIPGGKQILARKSGHYVQRDEPRLVVAAIRQVVEEARAKARRPRKKRGRFGV